MQKKKTNTKTTSTFYVRKSVFNSPARSSPPVLFFQAERGMSPEGKRGTQLTGGQKISTATATGYWH